MSWTKCDCHGRTYTGKASNVYARMAFTGQEDVSQRIKLCPSGLSDLLGVCSRYFTSSDTYDGDGSDLFQTCAWCGNGRGPDGGAAIFLTVYKNGREREDFAACACDVHMHDAARELSLAL